VTPRTAAPAWQRLWTLGVPLVLLLLGTAVRLRQYAGARSLWLDEAFLAESLTTRGPVELVSEPLAYSQSAPLGWLLAVRSVVAVAGTSEQALRLVPLLCGLAALPLAWLLARRLLPAGAESAAVPVVVALVALSPPLIGYSNELKPYSADVAAVLLVVVLGLRAVDARGRRLWTLTAWGRSSCGSRPSRCSRWRRRASCSCSTRWVTRGWSPAARTALVLAPLDGPRARRLRDPHVAAEEQPARRLLAADVPARRR
jgi:hypothetical protein